MYTVSLTKSYFSPSLFNVIVYVNSCTYYIVLYRVQLEQSFVPLSSPCPGDACAVKYSQDGVWYRGRVASHPHHSKGAKESTVSD